MILSTDHKFIFIANSKTGTTSIEAVLARFDRGDRYRFAAPGLFSDRHIPAAILRALVPAEVWDSSFKFCFVRNPYDWFVSQWFYLFGVKPRPGQTKVRQALRRTGQVWRNTGRRRGFSTMPKGDLSRRTCFSADDVVFLFERLAREHRIVPWEAGSFQTSFMFDADGRQIVDFIGRYENLTADFHSVVERLALDLALPQVNRSSHEHWRGYFDNRSAEAVHELWRQDFEAFGYERLAFAG